MSWTSQSHGWQAAAMDILTMSEFSRSRACHLDITVFFKWQCHEIFKPNFLLLITLHLGPLQTGKKALLISIVVKPSQFSGHRVKKNISSGFTQKILLRPAPKSSFVQSSSLQLLKEKWTSLNCLVFHLSKKISSRASDQILNRLQLRNTVN